MKFVHRYSSHTDRSRGALAAEERGLESARHAGKRLKLGYELLSEVAREELEDDPEWHHMRVSHRGPAEEIDYRPPQEWNAVAEIARRVRRKEIRLAREERAGKKRPPDCGGGIRRLLRGRAPGVSRWRAPRDLRVGAMGRPLDGRRAREIVARRRAGERWRGNCAGRK